MTFDFSTDWIGALSHGEAISPLAPARPTAPLYPTASEIALLLKELVAEGSLSLNQLRHMSAQPELAGYLEPGQAR